MTGLRKVKRLQQDELAGVAHAAVRQYEGGHKKPGPEVVEHIADALDCTMDYLYGRGKTFGGDTDAAYRRAATEMSFDLFSNDRSVTEEQVARCRRVLSHPDAPTTVRGWKAFAEMMTLAIGPPPTRFDVVTGRR
jgi:transcriptional regulator with XRE-family HTH domain